jgi:hypothetical protein
VSEVSEVVFLLDEDNTLLDNDRIAADLAIEHIGDLLGYDWSVLPSATEPREMRE